MGSGVGQRMATTRAQRSLVLAGVTLVTDPNQHGLPDPGDIVAAKEAQRTVRADHAPHSRCAVASRTAAITPGFTFRPADSSNTSNSNFATALLGMRFNASSVATK